MAVRPMITLEDVSKTYVTGEVETPVFRETSLQIEENQFVVVLGVSGSGKTTLLNLIGALDVPSYGKIFVDGEEITGKSRRELTEFRKMKLGFIFQFYNLMPTLSAQENVEAGLELLGLPSNEVSRKARNYLKLVGLEGKGKKFPSQLSGGEQQRVAIARALAKEPRVILADEPTGNLDEQTSLQIIDLMKEVRKKTGATFVVVTHNPKLTEIATRVLHIHDGKIINS